MQWHHKGCTCQIAISLQNLSIKFTTLNCELNLQCSIIFNTNKMCLQTHMLTIFTRFFDHPARGLVAVLAFYLDPQECPAWTLPELHLCHQQVTTNHPRKNPLCKKQKELINTHIYIYIYTYKVYKSSYTFFLNKSLYIYTYIISYTYIYIYQILQKTLGLYCKALFLA